jgi:hypothetical protein
MRKLTTGKSLAGSQNSTRPPPPGTGAAARTGPGVGLAGPVRVRQLEKMSGWTRRERLRFLWYRLRLAVQEMNYASRRMVELQARLPGHPLDQLQDGDRDNCRHDRRGSRTS